MASSTVKIIMRGILLLFCYAQLGLAVDYYVGDKFGWRLDTDYNAWINGKTFHVGDMLGFIYSDGHNVMEVDRDAFLRCDASHPISFSDDGETWIPLARLGERFFISGGQDDCRLGMALPINVV